MARKTWRAWIGEEITGLSALVLFNLVLFAAVFLFAANTAPTALHPITQTMWTGLGLGGMGALVLWWVQGYPTPKARGRKHKRSKSNKTPISLK